VKVAITGANGFVGRALSQHLQWRGHEVIRLLRSGTGAVDELITGDLSETTLRADALRDIDCVVHLAARTHVLTETAIEPLAAYRRTNVLGTERLLDAALAARVRRFVYMSSIKAAGEWTRPGQPFTAGV
jgi:nucleoside-diphosphate-sugar epimerase